MPVQAPPLFERLRGYRPSTEREGLIYLRAYWEAIGAALNAMRSFGLEPVEKLHAQITADIERQTSGLPLPAAFPRIVCLCGSTRFWREFQRASLAETLAGRIVLSIGAASGTDDEHFGNLPREEYDRVKAMLDELHLRKIDLADEVLVLNVGGYIGESTRREIAYAESTKKPVRYLEGGAPGKGARE